MNLPKPVEQHINVYAEKLSSRPKLQQLYKNCYANTIRTALRECEDGTFFVLTGDIPAMWLRDSSAQVTHYVKLCNHKEVATIIEGVLKRQFMYIEIDPYANAFNQESNGCGHTSDLPKNGPWVFERKYEIDSLCYPIRLLYLYWKQTGNTELIKERLESVAKTIIDLWQTEQYHFEKSPYRFFRENPLVPWETIHNDGMGNPVKYTGMTWSGFRPSDDGCEYGYLTASEMFAVVVLGYMAEMLNAVCGNTELANACIKLKEEIDKGIKENCIVKNEKYGYIYACETDGLGNYCMIDDANVPSLLSIPYIGYESVDSEVYMNTRKFLLSKDNPFYFEGEFAKGIGSRHTPENFVWHISLAMQGLTSVNKEEMLELLDVFERSDADTGYLHESFDVNNPKSFTRDWFTWPDSLFAEFVEKCVDNTII